jgi:outer membrane protein assembly factor BamE
MQKILLPVLLAFIAGCAEFPGVYKIDIEQGNVISQEMVDQLRPGMTKRQVRFIMGTPLIPDPFHQERWDYIYSMQPGGKKRDQQRLTIHFDGEDRLASLEGDYAPQFDREDSSTDASTEASEPAAVSAP